MTPVTVRNNLCMTASRGNRRYGAGGSGAGDKSVFIACAANCSRGYTPSAFPAVGAPGRTVLLIVRARLGLRLLNRPRNQLAEQPHNQPRNRTTAWERQYLSSYLLPAGSCRAPRTAGALGRARSTACALPTLAALQTLATRARSFFPGRH